MKKGWEIKKLGDVYDVRDGTHDSPKYHESGHPLVTSKNLKFGKIIWEDISYISDYDFLNINKRSKVDIGDVLFAMIGTIGNPVVVVEEPNFAIKNVALFKVRPGQNSWFLKYYLDSWDAIDRMNKEAKGTTQRFVGLGYLRNFEIPIPPLPEQQRIVALLDDAFEAIDQAKANTERNLQNARELFQSELNRIFVNKGEGWMEKTFEQILKVNQIGLIRSSKEQGPSKEFRYLKMDAITIDNSLLEKKCVFVDASNEEVEKYKLHMGDFLFNTRNSFELVGKTCVYYPESDEPTLFNNNIMRVKFIDGINAKFINYAFSSKGLKESLEKMKSGTTSVVGIYFNTLKNLLVPVTDIETQKHIVNQLDAISAETKRLEANYQKKLEGLEELKKSILQKAFSGELTRETTEIQMEQLEMVAEDQAMYNPNQ